MPKAKLLAAESADLNVLLPSNLDPSYAFLGPCLAPCSADPRRGCSVVNVAAAALNPP